MSYNPLMNKLSFIAHIFWAGIFIKCFIHLLIGMDITHNSFFVLGVQWLYLYLLNLQKFYKVNVTLI